VNCKSSNIDRLEIDMKTIRLFVHIMEIISNTSAFLTV
jgi:hypothetical protein